MVSKKALQKVKILIQEKKKEGEDPLRKTVEQVSEPPKANGPLIKDAIKDGLKNVRRDQRSEVNRQKRQGTWQSPLQWQHTKDKDGELFVLSDKLPKFFAESGIVPGMPAVIIGKSEWDRYNENSIVKILVGSRLIDARSSWLKALVFDETE